MSDIHPPDYARPDTPNRIVFDPASDDVPAMVGAVDPGPVVLLVNAAADRGWAADTAIALASAWGGEGRRIVLADLHLEEPVLHERIGDGNLDGVVDIFLYGASLARSARPIAGRNFYLIPTGTYTPDANVVYTHPRWSKLVHGFRDANATLLLFAPGDAPGVASLRQWTDQVIVLGDEGDAPPSGETASAEGARAILVPPSSAVFASEDATLESGEADHTLEPGDEVAAATAPESLEAEEEFLTSYSAEDRPGYEDSYTQPIPNPPAPPRTETEDEWVAEEEESPDSGTPPARRGTGRYLVWVLLGIAAIAAIAYLAASAAGLLGGDPGALPIDDNGIVESEVALDGDPSIGAEIGDPAPTGEPLQYAVQVRAFRTLDAAQEHAAAEERRIDGIPFYVSPEIVQGILYYKVLAGLPADSAAAVALRERLADARAIDPNDAAAAWLVQNVPLAFDMGEFESREAATTRAEALFALGIPAYAVSMPAPGGAERWRLYAGAFRDSARTEAMRELLDQAGVQAELIQRTGQPARFAASPQPAE